MGKCRNGLVKLTCFSIAFSIWLINILIFSAVPIPLPAFVLAVLVFYVGERTVVLWRLFLSILTIISEPSVLGLIMVRVEAFIMCVCTIFACHFMLLLFFIKYLERHSWLISVATCGGVG